MSNNYPTLFVVGAMKAGTTTAMGFISCQPGFNTGRIKEPDLFASGSSEAQIRLRCRLNYAGRAGVRVDGTTEYSKPRLSTDYASRIQRLVPDARILFLVRDPVTRAISHYQHNLSRGVETHPVAAEVMTAASDYVLTSRYRDCISPWISRFPSQVCIVNSDRLFAGESEEKIRVRSFLGLASDAPIEFDRLNANGAVSNVKAARAISKSLPGYSLIRPMIPSSVRGAAVKATGVLERSATEGTAWAPDLEGAREQLEHLLADEVLWLGNGCPLEDLL